MKPSAVVIGAGIVGLATARALATNGYKVTVIERNLQANGASIRNFGMIWPVGQPSGNLYETAMLSRNIWKDICQEARIWYEEAGSLHVAYRQDEWMVLQELAEVYRDRKYVLLNKQQTKLGSPAVVQDELKGSLFSRDEMIVDARIAIPRIATWLKEKHAVDFIFGKTITGIQYPVAVSADQSWEADEIYVCSGADFETLYPQLFRYTSITKCKLQMMRLVGQPGGWRLGAAVCGPLSLLHYNSFHCAGSWRALKKRYDQEYRELLDHGIHVMVCQNQAGELTVGDSHEYGLNPDPFDRQAINQLIIDYLKTFTRLRDDRVQQTWNGVYAKLSNGETFFYQEPENGVAIINGLGGAGMTLSFGLCEQLVAKRRVNSLLVENSVALAAEK